MEPLLTTSFGTVFTDLGERIKMVRGLQNSRSKRYFKDTVLPEKARSKYRMPADNSRTGEYIFARLQKTLRERYDGPPLTLDGSFMKRLGELDVLLKLGMAYEKNGLTYIKIPGLHKATGEYTHLGFGRVYGKPVVYIDEECAGNDYYREIAEKYAGAKLTQWEQSIKNKNALRGLRDVADISQWMTYHGKEADELEKDFHEIAAWQGNVDLIGYFSVEEMGIINAIVAADRAGIDAGIKMLDGQGDKIGVTPYDLNKWCDLFRKHLEARASGSLDNDRLEWIKRGFKARSGPYKSVDALIGKTGKNYSLYRKYLLRAGGNILKRIYSAQYVLRGEIIKDLKSDDLRAIKALSAAKRGYPGAVYEALKRGNAAPSITLSELADVVEMWEEHLEKSHQPGAKGSLYAGYKKRIRELMTGTVDKIVPVNPEYGYYFGDEPHDIFDGLFAGEKGLIPLKRFIDGEKLKSIAAFGKQLALVHPSFQGKIEKRVPLRLYSEKTYRDPLDLDLHTLLIKGHAPEYAFSFGEDTYYVSRPFDNGGGRHGFIVYVYHTDRFENKRKLFVNGVYRSNSHGVWKVASHHFKHWLGKGLEQNFQTMPMELLSELEGILERSHVIEKRSEDIYDVLGPGGQLPDASQVDSHRAVSREEFSDESLPEGTFRKETVIAKLNYIAPFWSGGTHDLSFDDEEYKPDFKRGYVKRWGSRNDLYGNITHYIVRSVNDRIQYLFNVNEEGLIWIGAIQSRTTALTRQGVRLDGPNIVFPEELLLPAYEYRSSNSIPTGYAGRSNPRNDHYCSTGGFHMKFQIFRDFKEEIINKGNKDKNVSGEVFEVKGEDSPFRVSIGGEGARVRDTDEVIFTDDAAVEYMSDNGLVLYLPGEYAVDPDLYDHTLKTLKLLERYRIDRLGFTRSEMKRWISEDTARAVRVLEECLDKVCSGQEVSRPKVGFITVRMSIRDEIICKPGAADESRLKKAFTALSEEAKKDPQIGSSLAKMKKNCGDIIDARKLRAYIPVEVFRGSPDIAGALETTGLLKRLVKNERHDRGEPEPLEFELVVTGVKDGDKALIESITGQGIKDDLGMPVNLTVSTIKESDIREWMRKRCGYDPDEVRSRVAAIKDFIPGDTSWKDMNVIATRPVESAVAARREIAKIKGYLKGELEEDNISVRVLVSPGERGALLLSDILANWFGSVRSGKSFTIDLIMPKAEAMTGALVEKMSAVWMALKSA